MNEISLEEMLKAGVHFGHKTSRVYPKMKSFVFSERGGVSIIDLEKTKEKIIEAQNFLEEVAKRGGNLLFVGTKRQAQSVIKKYADELGMPYVNERWVGGTFTNFPVIKKMINKFKKLKEEEKTGQLDKFTKKERLKIREEIEKLNKSVGGIENMEKIPEAIYVIDVKNENTVIREAVRKKIPVVALVDVNCNPKGVDYLIPANDDASKSIELVTGLLAEAYKKGKSLNGENKNDKEHSGDNSSAKGEK